MVATLKSVTHGTLVPGQTWSVGLNHVTAAGIPSTATMVAAAQAIYAAFLNRVWNAATQPVKSYVSSLGNVLGTNLYYYVTPGSPSVVQGSSTGALAAGTNAAACHPPQCALVASLLSDFSGRNARGRIYIPFNGGTVGNTLVASNAHSQNLSSQIAAWIRDVDAAAFGSDLMAVITSPRADAHTVTRVRVDNVVDTQRRRRDKIAATDVTTTAV